MKRGNTPAWAITALYLAIFLFCFGNQASAQGTPKLPPDTRQDPVTAADQTPSPPPTQSAPMPQHTLTIGRAGNGQGKVTTNPAGTLFKKGLTVTIRAIPDINSVFAGWSGSCSGASPVCPVILTADKTVTASFAIKIYTIRVPSPVNGVIHPSGLIKATHGEKRRFQIIPLPGYRVSEVLVDKHSVGAVSSYTFNNVTTDHAVEVVFMKQ
jgi:uncharacterized repeat protein (TIGR02543 family)